MKGKAIISFVAIIGIIAMIIYTIKESINDFAEIEPYHGEAVVDGERVEGAVGLQKGDTPPNIQLKSLTGEVTQLHQLQGKKVILNFWASWCGPCKVEMPHMEQYYRKYKEKHNVEIVAVNLTSDERKGKQGIEQFVKSYRLTFPILLDQEGYTKNEYMVKQIPTTYLIHEDGTIAYKVMGPLNDQKLIELIESMED